MKMILSIALTLVLTGCSGMLSPEQMAAAAKDRNQTIACAAYSGLTMRTIAVYVDANRIADEQAIRVEADCAVSVISSK
jgi:hypothetical protein